MWADPLQLLAARQREHGDFVASRLFGRDVFLVSDPDAIQYVLQKNAKNYVKSHTYDALRVVLGDGLLTSEGEFWLRQRKLAQPWFHRERLDGFVDIMARATAETIARWDEVAAQRGEVDLHAEMMRLTLRIVGEALFSSDVDGAAAEIGNAVTTALDTFDRFMGFVVIMPPWLRLPRNVPIPRIRRVKAALDDLVFGMIEHRRGSAEQRHDLLSMLLEARDDDGQAMTDRQIRDEVLTLLIAGHETTAVALTWAFLLLGDHPDAERRIAAEAAGVLDGRAPTLGTVQELAFTARVVDETLRLYPPAWVLGRQAVADDEIAGYRVPAGSMIQISPYVLHRDPRLWPDPERFDPDRFAAPPESRHRYSYLPFGGGQRICIGNRFALIEAALVLAMLVSRYQIARVDPAPVEAHPSITLRPRGGLRVTLSPRSAR